MGTKELSTEVKSYSLDLTSEGALQTLIQTVAKGATPPELALFVEMCRSTGLNPFKREIWFIKTGQGGVQMMTGINGFYQIANKHPMYDGTETEIVEENGRIIKAVARVHRKDRKIPSVAEAYMEEYAKPYGNWKTMPRVMISKCAESMALRKAFPQELNGLYSTEEMPREFAAPQETKIVSAKTIEQQSPGLSEEYKNDMPEWLKTVDLKASDNMNIVEEPPAPSAAATVAPHRLPGDEEVPEWVREEIPEVAAPAEPPKVSTKPAAGDRSRKGVSAGKYAVYEIPYKDKMLAEQEAGTSWKKTFYCPEIGTLKRVTLCRTLIPALDRWYKATIVVNDKGSVRFDQGEDMNPHRPVAAEPDGVLDANI